ncbi:MAG: regulatory protein RecX [Armatimonadetes bacterium]|nr:hypothetical protein [Armatimonadota bacterium]MBS1703314.1 regulatory protein RecX [Armatimonadota bacterium]MBS1729079.1 regulatory protein RecX [Armatimonadota bacterium]
MNSDVHAALLAALKILKRQDLTIQEVAHRLESNFEPTVICEALEFLQTKRILDDVRLARLAIERNEGRRAVGDEALRAKLESRGVPPEVVAELFAEADLDELSRALVLVDAKFSGSQNPGRVARFLASRGFSEETIESILDRIGMA